MPIPDGVLNTIEARAADFSGFDDDLVRTIITILEDMQEELLERLRIVDPSSPPKETVRRARMRRLLVQTNVTIDRAYRQISKASGVALERAASSELAFSHELLRQYMLPLGGLVSINTVAVSPGILRELARGTVVNMGDSLGGQIMSEWLKGQSADTQARFAQQVIRGVQAGEGIAPITNRLVGTRGTTGALQIPRRFAETLARTSIQAVTGEARRRQYAENQHILKGIYQISTDDDRTTLICLAYASKSWLFTPDGSLEPVNHSLPYAGGVPRHPSCRSVDVPWVKSIEELGLKTEDVPARSRKLFDGKLPPGKRGVDMLERAGLDGQNTRLGPTRASMWRQGRIELEDLISKQGKTRNIAQLKQIASARKNK